MSKLEYTDAMVRRKLNQLYPASADRELAEMLLTLIESRTKAGRCRLCLCVLKLAGTDLELMEHYVEVAAEKDPRDVMAWAQYPEQGKHRPGSLSEEEKERVMLRDEQQFQDWLDHGNSE